MWQDGLEKQHMSEPQINPQGESPRCGPMPTTTKMVTSTTSNRFTNMHSLIPPKSEDDRRQQSSSNKTREAIAVAKIQNIESRTKAQGESPRVRQTLFSYTVHFHRGPNPHRNLLRAGALTLVKGDPSLPSHPSPG